MISVVIRSMTACWTAGSLASGADGLDVAVGVGDRVVRPAGDHRERGQDRHEDDQDGRDDRAPPARSRRGSSAGRATVGGAAASSARSRSTSGSELLDLGLLLVARSWRPLLRSRYAGTAAERGDDARMPATISQIPTKTTSSFSDRSV